MKSVRVLFLISLFFGILVSVGSVEGKSLDDKKARVVELYSGVPLYFIQNDGQVDKRVRYYFRGLGKSVYFTKDGVYIVLSKNMGSFSGVNGRVEGVKLSKGEEGVERVVREALFLIPLSGNKEVELISEEPFSGKVNYFIGSDPKGWRANVATYGRVRYREIYPGVDIVFYGNQGELEYDVLVKPGSDHNLVKFECKGVKELRVGNDGELIAVLPSGGEVIQRRPRVYQEIDGKKVELKGEYFVEKEKGRWFFGFKVSDYNKHYALVIDPVLVYSTYLGGIGFDRGLGIAVDSSGNAYVTGFTWLSDFPTQNAFQETADAFGDAFVTKLSPSGSLIYSTYLGGSGGDIGEGIAVDAAGHAYVTGGTESADFPTTQNAFQRSYGGRYRDAFVTKLSPSGDSLIYSTYLGGIYDDGGSSITVDSYGHAYVTGRTGSPDFPTQNAFQGSFAGCNDAFVTKLSPEGNTLIYSTYLGGSGFCERGYDVGTGIAVDSSGNAYVTGVTWSTDFPTLNAFDPNCGTDGTCNSSELAPSGFPDVFVTKLSPTGSLIYSTYLGGSFDDGPPRFVVGPDVWTGGPSIAVDSSGNAYVTGSTGSPDFPTRNAFQGTNAGSLDVFVTKLSPSGDSLLYSTYLGGKSDDSGFRIAVDASGNAYVTGATTSTDFPTRNAFQGSFGGASLWIGDAFVTKLSPSGDSLLYSTYLGGSGGDWGEGIAVDAAGHAYVTGSTGSLNFPTQNAFQGSFGGWADAFVVKIGEEGLGGGSFTITTPGDMPLTDKAVNEPFQIKVTAKDARGGTDTSWSGQVMLSATNGGLSTNSIYLTAGIGVKTVSITIPGAGVKLTAFGGGRSGESNAFTVGSACPGSLGGTVKRSGMPLAGADVYLDGESGTFHTTSGGDGWYSFSGVPSGNYTLWAQSSDGGKSESIPVYVSCGSISWDLNVYSACNPSGKTPVLLVPGIMGSTLKEHPIEIFPTLHNDGFVKPSDMELYDGSATDYGWNTLREMLKAEPYKYQENCTLFDVPYDWRLDIRDIVDKYLIPAIDKAKEKAETPKVNIIAHSMGGLVTREYIQGASYRGDIDRFAMIGTPNHGSGNAYPLWEGGDPFTADFIARNLPPVYTPVAVYLVEGPEVAKWAEDFIKSLIESKACQLVTGGNSWLCIVGGVTKLYLKVANYIYEHVPSLGQLMPTYPMLDRPTGLEKVECLRNDWLDQLNRNNLSRFTNYNDGDPSKVRTMLFIGVGEDTVLKLTVALKNCLTRLYPDGLIFWFDREPIGDGTVLKSSAELPGIVAKYKGGEHAKLMGVFAPEVVDFITGGDGVVTTRALQAYSSIRAAVTSTKSLSIATQGTVRPLIITPLGQKIGIENGQYVNQAPESTEVNIGVDLGGITIENPPDGTYTVILADTNARDYQIAISFSDSAGSEAMAAAHGFHHAETLSFTFTLDSTSSDNPLIINYTPPPPTGLQANAVEAGGLKTRLTWDPSPDPEVDHYNVYGKNIDEPYFTMIGTSTANLYDPGDPWDIDSSITTRVYAVSAVKADGTESFLSATVENDDRDHDGVSDEEEASVGTDPDNPDSDGDGLRDGEEYLLGTNPLRIDTDGDGFSDYDEVQVGSDPLDAASTPKRLTVNKTGTGSGAVTATGCTLSWAGNTGTCTVSSGTQITLTGVADPGSTFSGWSEGTGSASSCTGTGECKFTITEDSSIKATFNAQPRGTYTLTVNKIGDGSGRVKSSPRGIDCGNKCSGSFSSGKKVNLVATPSSGSTFGGWLGDCSGIRRVTSVVMTSDKSCTAIFNRRVGRR